VRPGVMIRPGFLPPGPCAASWLRTEAPTFAHVFQLTL